MKVGFLINQTLQILLLKKEDTTDKINYRPISILSALSKIFERVLFAQISTYFDQNFSMFLYGFRKGCSTQYTLFNLIQNWQSCLDKGGVIGAILSKAYDCLSHDVLLAKLETYSFDLNSLNLIHSYLSSGKQRVNVGFSFSKWLEVFPKV